jgi:hypothetical protein
VSRFTAVTIGERVMSNLSPLASALHSKIWPLVGKKCVEQCETIDAENAYMNIAVECYAPHLLETPVEILALIWGVHVDEAILWREDIRTAIRDFA